MSLDTEATKKFMYDPVFHAKVTLVKHAFISLDCPEERLMENVYCAALALYMEEAGLLDVKGLVTTEELKEMHIDMMLAYGPPSKEDIDLLFGPKPASAPES